MTIRAFIIVAFLLITPAVIAAESEPHAHAEEFYHRYFDGYEYPLNYQISNGTVLNMDSDSMTFHVNGTNGELALIVPKTIPFNHGNSWGLLVMNVFRDGMDMAEFNTVSTTCDFKITVSFDGESEIAFDRGDILTGQYRLTYLEMPKRCLDDPKYDTEIQREINAIQCADSGHKKYLNARGEAVCVTDDSFPALYQRGYLTTFPILIDFMYD